MSLLKVSIRALKELKDLAADLGDCDHSAGVCNCDLYQLIDDFEAEIKKEEEKGK